MLHGRRRGEKCFFKSTSVREVGRAQLSATKRPGVREEGFLLCTVVHPPT
jgi:hypothetical protein